MTAVATFGSQLRPDFVFANHSTILNADIMADRRMSSANESSVSPTTLLLRRLPINAGPEAVRTMLLFAKDLKDTEIVPNEYDEDRGFTTAIARFSSINGAREAMGMLNGKPNTAGQASMIVDVVSGPALAALGRRNTIDPLASRKITHSVSPPLTNSQRPSRFNGAFQSIDKIAPPLNSEHSSSEAIQTIFSPQSPNANLHDRSRITGKLVIGEEGNDEDTGELLKDPLAYLNNNSASRKQPRVPIAAFGGLSLDTSVNGGMYGPRSAAANPYSPRHLTPSIHSPYPMTSQPYLRHNYPPVNPADQNPPCNTLYVGNLPIDTSEDELKALFSKQRGYKRLCFRTKQNGPMCFVEFEDVSFATKALNELYGVQLHNSVKGGIRLSFSKNPLGVRAGQPGSNISTPITAIGPMGLTSPTMGQGAFSSANGPPPGLSIPSGPGNNMGPPPPSSMANAAFMNQGRPMPTPSSNTGPNMGLMYPDYMLGR